MKFFFPKRTRSDLDFTILMQLKKVWDHFIQWFTRKMFCWQFRIYFTKLAWPNFLKFLINYLFKKNRPDRNFSAWKIYQQFLIKLTFHTTRSVFLRKILMSEEIIFWLFLVIVFSLNFNLLCDRTPSWNIM